MRRLLTLIIAFAAAIVGFQASAVDALPPNISADDATVVPPVVVLDRTTWDGSIGSKTFKYGFSIDGFRSDKESRFATLPTGAGPFKDAGDKWTKGLNFMNNSACSIIIPDGVKVYRIEIFGCSQGDNWNYIYAYGKGSNNYSGVGYEFVDPIGVGVKENDVIRTKAKISVDPCTGVESTSSTHHAGYRCAVLNYPDNPVTGSFPFYVSGNNQHDYAFKLYTNKDSAEAAYEAEHTIDISIAKLDYADLRLKNKWDNITSDSNKLDRSVMGIDLKLTGSVEALIWNNDWWWPYLLFQGGKVNVSIDKAKNPNASIKKVKIGYANNKSVPPKAEDIKLSEGWTSTLDAERHEITVSGHGDNVDITLGSVGGSVQVDTISVVYDGEMADTTTAPVTLAYEQPSITTSEATVNNPLKKTQESLPIIFSSSNPDVAQVNLKTGVVTRKSYGQATITATYKPRYYSNSGEYHKPLGSYFTETSASYVVTFECKSKTIDILPSELKYDNVAYAGTVIDREVYGIKAEMLDLVINNANTADANFTLLKSSETNAIRLTVDAEKYPNVTISKIVAYGSTSKSANTVLGTQNGNGSNMLEFNNYYLDRNLKAITKFTVTLSDAIQLEPVKPKMTANNNITLRSGEVDYLNVETTPKHLSDITYSSSDESVATVDDRGKVSYVGEGTAVITAHFSGQPHNWEGGDQLPMPYFQDAEVQATVICLPALSRKKWQFEAVGDSKGIAGGASISSDDNWGAADAKGEQSYKGSISNSELKANGETIANTGGLLITTTDGSHLAINPGKYLEANKYVSFRIDNVAVGTHLLVDAASTNSLQDGGFTGGKDSAVVENRILSKAFNRQTFMLEVKKGGVITFRPTRGMHIYSIELTDKQVPVVTATYPSKTTNAQVKVKPTYTSSVSAGAFSYYVNQPDDPGYQLVTIDADGSVRSSEATSAIIVAKFTPADTAKYTIGYGMLDLTFTNPGEWHPILGESYGCNEVIDHDNVELTLGGWPLGTYYRNEKKGTGQGGTEDSWTDRGESGSADRTFKDFNSSIGSNANSGDENSYEYANGMETEARRTKTQSYYVYDWYNNTTVDKAPNNPYGMPNRGGFLKFVPKLNGVLTFYVNQNGAHDLTDGRPDQTKFRMRNYYVADETGRLLTVSNGGLTSVTAIGHYSNDWLGPNDKATGGMLNTWDGSDTEHEAEFLYVRDTLGLKNATVETPLQAYEKNNGYFVVEPTQVEYVLPVKVGKTYFVLTHLTKLEFAGFKFKATDVDQSTGQPAADKTDEVVLPKETNTEYTQPVVNPNMSYFTPRFEGGKKLNANMWNAVCLPFTMNEQQTKEAFGDDCEIFDLDRVETDKIVFKKHWYQMIVSGRPYLVWTSNDEFKAPATVPYVSFDNAKALAAPINVDVDSVGEGYTWIGTYAKTTLPYGSYFIPSRQTASGTTQVTQSLVEGSTVRGYRAYLGTIGGKNLPKRSFAIDMNGVVEEVTGIQQVELSDGDTETSGVVYSLSGQKVSSCGLQALPSGVYIMNGRKYVVR